MSPLETALVLLLIILPLVSTTASVVLVRAARQHPPIRALTERAIVSVLGTIAGWMVGLLSANALLGLVALQRPWTTLAIVGALLLFTAPGPVFLVLYSRGYLRDDR